MLKILLILLLITACVTQHESRNASPVTSDSGIDYPGSFALAEQEFQSASQSCGLTKDQADRVVTALATPADAAPSADAASTPPFQPVLASVVAVIGGVALIYGVLKYARGSQAGSAPSQEHLQDIAKLEESIRLMKASFISAAITSNNLYIKKPEVETLDGLLHDIWHDDNPSIRQAMQTDLTTWLSPRVKLNNGKWIALSDWTNGMVASNLYSAMTFLHNTADPNIQEKVAIVPQEYDTKSFLLRLLNKYVPGIPIQPSLTTPHKKLIAALDNPKIEKIVVEVRSWVFQISGHSTLAVINRKDKKVSLFDINTLRFVPSWLDRKPREYVKDVIRLIKEKTGETYSFDEPVINLSGSGSGPCAITSLQVCDRILKGEEESQIKEIRNLKKYLEDLHKRMMKDYLEIGVPRPGEPAHKIIAEEILKRNLTDQWLDAAIAKLNKMDLKNTTYFNDLINAKAKLLDRIKLAKSVSPEEKKLIDENESLYSKTEELVHKLTDDGLNQSKDLVQSRDAFQAEAAKHRAAVNALPAEERLVLKLAGDTQKTSDDPCVAPVQRLAENIATLQTLKHANALWEASTAASN